MASPLTRLLGWLLGPPPRLRCNRSIWADGVRQLERRTRGGRQESGAYLLGTELPDGGRRILEFVYYDDIDPRALETGEVTIRQTALPRLWELCRRRGYGVVADVHVHPGSCRQSGSDMASPVMPRAGHIAMILPDFARGAPEPGAIGIYEFLGGGRWADHSSAGRRFVKLDAAS
jgi:proteasome lid subunit RPN8/RPN11